MFDVVDSDLEDESLADSTHSDGTIDVDQAFAELEYALGDSAVRRVQITKRFTQLREDMHTVGAYAPPNTLADPTLQATKPIHCC